ncbi:hypothetical protein M011DRAFT_400388 [Sporormia fimetaria CBS 119925]|uniref:DUF6594 domain-containing protein n=1 Tax=Sporormia fimetaria CBS 119925 TaxID=1340428 RepID=A0A6A6VFL5_9PLEO|nr:hypothetical protein M011DRAFT_400388 [Sporormia fimetaria CBS 119925]
MRLPTPATSTATANKPTNTDVPTESHDPLKKFVRGYPKLAGRMALVPETAMFRRFRALNFKNLLYLQNEIMTLEKKLQRWEKHDSRSPVGMRHWYARDNAFLCSSSVERDGGTEQRDMVLKIRELLKEYSPSLQASRSTNSLEDHALIQQHTILKMSPPDVLDLKDLQHYIACDQFGIQYLAGIEEEVWGSYDEPNKHSDELICLRPREHTDVFSKWLGSKSVAIVTKCFGKRPDSKLGVVRVRVRKIQDMTYGLTTGIASAIPIICIAVLNEVDSKGKRIAVIAAFNVLLALCLALLTEAKRYEVFAVTAS